MTYTLYVSNDCGVRYRPYHKADTIEELLPFCDKYDSDMKRWYIEDGNGKMCKPMSAIHRSIFELLVKLRK